MIPRRLGTEKKKRNPVKRPSEISSLLRQIQY